MAKELTKEQAIFALPEDTTVKIRFNTSAVDITALDSLSRVKEMMRQSDKITIQEDLAESGGLALCARKITESGRETKIFVEADPDKLQLIRGGHASDCMLEIEYDGDRGCLSCGDAEGKTAKIKLKRLKTGDNIICFNLCCNCLIRLAREFRIYS